MVVTVLTPLSSEEHNAAWLEIRSPRGSFIIKDQHAPMVVPLLDNSEVTLHLSNGKQIAVPVKHGIAHIKRDQVSLFLFQ